MTTETAVSDMTLWEYYATLRTVSPAYRGGYAQLRDSLQILATVLETGEDAATHKETSNEDQRRSFVGQKAPEDTTLLEWCGQKQHDAK